MERQMGDRSLVKGVLCLVKHNKDPNEDSGNGDGLERWLEEYLEEMSNSATV